MFNPYFSKEFALWTPHFSGDFPPAGWSNDGVLDASQLYETWEVLKKMVLFAAKDRKF